MFQQGYLISWVPCMSRAESLKEKIGHESVACKWSKLWVWLTTNQCSYNQSTANTLRPQYKSTVRWVTCKCSGHFCFGDWTDPQAVIKWSNVCLCYNYFWFGRILLNNVRGVPSFSYKSAGWNSELPNWVQNLKKITDHFRGKSENRENSPFSAGLV